MLGKLGQQEHPHCHLCGNQINIYDAMQLFPRDKEAFFARAGQEELKNQLVAIYGIDLRKISEIESVSEKTDTGARLCLDQSNYK